MREQPYKVEVPFIKFGDRRGLTRVQVFENDFVCEFVERFRDCFEYDEFLNVYLFIEPDQRGK